MILRTWLSWCLPILIAAYSATTFGASLQQLQSAGHVSVDISLTPDSGIVPGQRVTLTLTVATDTWFTGGTRIGIPEVPGLVILQTEQFANNASEMRNGKSWVVQRWNLDLFPQRAGNFTIEPLPLKVQVNAGQDDNVAGEIRSPPVQFTVAIPESLTAAESWVAAPEFRVSQRFNRALDGLATGDAFEQEVIFEASDVLAMMLPDYDAPKQPGLAAYPSPPTLDDSSNRGQTLARRSVTVSYVIEQPGHFVLPASDYYWWNTQSAELELLSLPETRIDVAGAASPEQTQQKGFSPSPKQWLILAVSLTLLVAAVRLAQVLLPRLPVSRWRHLVSEKVHQVRGLFKPALATRLNPGSNAEE